MHFKGTIYTGHLERDIGQSKEERWVLDNGWYAGQPEGETASVRASTAISLIKKVGLGDITG
jgi:hypothetical protein